MIGGYLPPPEQWPLPFTLDGGARYGCFGLPKTLPSNTCSALIISSIIYIILLAYSTARTKVFPPERDKGEPIQQYGDAQMREIEWLGTQGFSAERLQFCSLTEPVVEGCVCLDVALY